MTEKKGFFTPPLSKLKIVVIAALFLAFGISLLFFVADQNRISKIDKLEKELVRIEQIQPEKYHQEQIKKLKEKIRRLKGQ